MKLIVFFRECSFKLFGEKNATTAVNLFLEGGGYGAAGNFSQFVFLMILKLGDIFGISTRLISSNRRVVAKAPKGREYYDGKILNLMTNRIFDMPEVVVCDDCPKRINVLVPAFSINSISAGFFGVFNVALYVQSLGYRVRLVLFDNFYYSENEFRLVLDKFPSFRSLFDRVEVEYIGDRRFPLCVSRDDGVVATVWYSAYFAEKIVNSIKRNGKFLYLIQDYESQFYAASAMSEFAERSYRMNYSALISTEPLRRCMLERGVVAQSTPAIAFNNACSAKLPDRAIFLEEKKCSKKKFIFYSRPSVNRNMFELAALSIIAAYRAGVFEGEWEFYGMGIGDVDFDLGGGLKVSQVPRMTLQDYEDNVWKYDLCLSLMASPHPSIVPFDLAGAGAIVVTNSYREKDSRYFENISKNIHVAEPVVNSIVDALRDAVSVIDDISSRYDNARQMNYPRSWADVWSREHALFVGDIFGGVND